MKVYEPTQIRWQRRYGGRRWVMGVPVHVEPIGSMVDDFVAFDIALRRLWHVLRVPLLRIARSLNDALGMLDEAVRKR